MYTKDKIIPPPPPPLALSHYVINQGFIDIFITNIFKKNSLQAIVKMNHTKNVPTIIVVRRAHKALVISWFKDSKQWGGGISKFIVSSKLRILS